MRTLISDMTADECRALVEQAQNVLSGDPEDFTRDLKDASGRIIENYKHIVNSALTEEL